VRFPKTVKHRRAEATIYGKSKAYPFYRVAFHVAGRRQMKSFATYGGEDGAKHWADAKVRELAKGSQAAALTPKQAGDALAALERLQTLFQATGKRYSLLGAVSEFAEATAGVNVPLSEVVEGYKRTVAAVKRSDVLEAVELFIAERKKRTVAEDGKRPKLSPEHHYNTSRWLLEFGRTFPGHAVCDLTSQHLAKYMEQHTDVGPKTKNERRAVVKMFLQWCCEQEQEYLAKSSRLFDSKALKPEKADDSGDVECYTAKDLRTMLERASRPPEPPKNGEGLETDYRDLLPVLALGGLAGMRFKEILRLTWEDVFRVPDHIEVKAHKSKTRSRRLIQASSALTWLEPYRGRTGMVWQVPVADGAAPRTQNLAYVVLGENMTTLRAELNIAHRKNGLRHSFVSAHFAVHADEGLTSMQAGNSPAVVHKNYKGLMTKKEGEAWFAVSPPQPRT